MTRSYFFFPIFETQVIRDAKLLFDDNSDLKEDHFIRYIDSHIKYIKEQFTETELVCTPDIDNHIFDPKKKFTLEFCVLETFHMTFLMIINHTKKRTYIFDKSQLSLTDIDSKEIINKCVLQFVIGKVVPDGYYVQNFEEWYRENNIESIIELFRTNMLKSSNDSDILESKLGLLLTKNEYGEYKYWKKKLTNDQICNHCRVLV